MEQAPESETTEEEPEAPMVNAYLDRAARYIQFFRTPRRGTAMIFAWVPVGRVPMSTDQLALVVLDNGTQVVSFNDNPPHGSWTFDDQAAPADFLDVKVNVQFGEPGNVDAAHVGKRVRFQKIPGAQCWIGTEDEHTWDSVLAPVYGH